MLSTLITSVVSERKLLTIDINTPKEVIDSMKYIVDDIIIGDFRCIVLDVPSGVNMLFPGVVDFENDDIVTADVYQWGLDRIDQKKLPLNQKEYTPKLTGKEVSVYVLDTGVMVDHVELKGKVKNGKTFYKSHNDGYGHGTHVASTIAGNTVGVSPDVKIIGVKVLSDYGSGSISNVIKGIEWSVEHSKKRNKCSIISMSLGGSKSLTLNKAVNAAFNLGIPVVVAAGNSNRNSCYYSPASAKNALTIGSTDIKDFRSSFSNYGECVNIFAPGTEIVGSSIKGKKEYETFSGTSMACPHVSGLLAQYFEKNGCSNIQESIDELIKNAINRKLKNIPNNTPNKLIYVNADMTKSPTIYTTPIPTSSPTVKPTHGKLNCKQKCKFSKNKIKCKSRDPWCKCRWYNKQKKCKSKRHN